MGNDLMSAAGLIHIIEESRQNALKKVNEELTKMYWNVGEFLEIKKRLLDIRENVRGVIKTTDKDIAKTALLAKGFREAGGSI